MKYPVKRAAWQNTERNLCGAGTYLGRSSTATVDDWCLRYDPETKRQCMEWHSPVSPRRKKVRAEKSRIRMMLITFFNSQGSIHKEFLPEGTTTNAVGTLKF
ncbi:hypothetical protein TNCV_3555831 [Trichonephila clavipes]|nr:hypothetical protein TNCV_3555831 [Trichonephila clavipes]